MRKNGKLHLFIHRMHLTKVKEIKANLFSIRFMIYMRICKIKGHIGKIDYI